MLKKINEDKYLEVLADILDSNFNGDILINLINKSL